MQIASFILVSDRRLRNFSEQLELALKDAPQQTTLFMHLVPMRLQEIGDEHPISIPFSSLLSLDHAAQRQHERMLSLFEEPTHPSRLRQLAQAANAPIYYVSPGRVRDFVRELEALQIVGKLRAEDVESFLGKRVTRDEMPAVAHIFECFRHDLYQVYRDASDQGKGVVVVVINQPEEITSEDGFPRAA